MKTKISIFIVLALAVILRFCAIGKFPVGFNADEASQGYTAYSILMTGKDEWGKALPLFPRSFGDFKPPVYTYSAILPIALFGLNEASVRSVGAFFGVLAVFATFLLTREIFKGSKKTDFLAVTVAFLLAISPWHVSLSRGAFEAALGCFFIPAGLWSALKGKEKTGYWWLSAIFFGFSLLTYHSPRLFIPLFLLLFGILERKEIIKKKKFFIGPLILFFIFVLMVAASFFNGGGARVSDVGIFSAGLIDGSRIFVSNYLSYFSLEFLFLKGAGQATYGMIINYGVLYILELPFLIFSFYKIIKDKDNKLILIILWLILAPIPGALSSGVGYHANRVAIMMPAIQIISGYGAVSVVSLFKGKKKFVFASVSLIAITVCLFSFCYRYFFISPKENAAAMAYGWREAVGYMVSKETQYGEILVSRRFCEPQAMIMFYSKYDPFLVQAETPSWMAYTENGSVFVDQLGEYRLGKYRFQAIEYSRDIELKKTLLVGKPDEFPKSVLPQKVIYYPNGLPAIFMIESLGRNQL